MHIDTYRWRASNISRVYPRGVTLIELLVFIVIVSAALGVFAKVFTNAVVNTVDPVLRLKAAEKAQAQMDEILARKFDENTPTGGIPACNSASGSACAGIAPDAKFDDVGDFNGFTDNTDTSLALSVSVIEDGSSLGLVNSNARLITVTVTMQGGDALSLSAYKVNF